jgi:GH18 family chitinase
MKIAYYEGYGMNRDCLFQDPSQIDTSQYTHVHFAFGTLTSDYEVEVGDELSTYNFGQFKRIKGAKKILSFGGWAFSTEPATYAIFRDGVTSANRLKMATNIANFIKKHDLDGVDIDWEYPGAPDIPGIPPASKADGPNYLAFLAVLRNLIPSSKTVSICAPSSYWYLKQYPIESIGKIVDYIVYMTYDLHGQWDAGNSHSQEGCDTGNCLRSQVNLTETKQSLAMITKAGVPGNKVIVGITSYGRSFNMAEAGCWGPSCLYTGSQMNSHATKGKCTDSAGYIADAEIAEIIEGKKRAGRVVKQFVDPTSNSDVLVYDDTQWVSYMSSNTKKTRSTLYSAWGMGGTTDWASDLQVFNDVPAPATSWDEHKFKVKTTGHVSDDSRNGDWTKYDCTHDMIVHTIKYTAAERWKGLDADGAWKDIVRIWKAANQDDLSFSSSLSDTLHINKMTCGDLLSSSQCEAIGTDACSKSMDGPLSGAAGALITESLVRLHDMYRDYHTALTDVAATYSMSMGKLMVSHLCKNYT